MKGIIISSLIIFISTTGGFCFDETQYRSKHQQEMEFLRKSLRSTKVPIPEIALERHKFKWNRTRDFKEPESDEISTMMSGIKRNPKQAITDELDLIDLNALENKKQVAPKKREWKRRRE